MKRKLYFKAFVIAAVTLTVMLISASHVPQTGAKTGGAAVYRQNCADCHGGDGRSQTAKGKRKGATDLTKSKISTAAGIRVIKNGRELMPGFKGALTDEEIAEVMEFIRGFRAN